MTDRPTLEDVVQQLSTELQRRGWMLATAESCTGGMIAAACTDLPGSSAWFDRGFVTYSNASKTDMLGVPAAFIAEHGAVSEAVACAMAQGAIEHSAAQVAIAVTGIAGPSGGSPDKPVGTVWVAWKLPSGIHSQCLHLDGHRSSIRSATVHAALTRLLAMLQTNELSLDCGLVH